MFTGIIESTGKVLQVQQEGTNRVFTICCQFVSELSTGQSVSHDGVCLTVTSVSKNEYKVTAVTETLNRTQLRNWKEGTVVNLERSMPASGRFDGHIVQGHVDATAVCTRITDKNGSRDFYFELPEDANQNLLVEKGSVCINGVSLTVVSCNKRVFSVTIIPHTLHVTGFGILQTGDTVNIEFDIVGKYIAQMLVKNTL